MLGELRSPAADEGVRAYAIKGRTRTCTLTSFLRKSSTLLHP